MFSIGKCTADHFEAPMGVGAMPRFGWVILGDGQGVRQVWYQLQLCPDASFDSPLYDSGRQDSDQSQYVRIDGVRLESARRYYFRVRAGLSTGDVTEWSYAHRFVTALLDPSEWQAKFVSPERPSDGDKSDSHYVRGAFRVDGPVKAAYAFSTALGVYHLFLNGEKVSPDQLAPGWTSYDKHLMVQTYDVTRLLLQGENCVGALLGAGWYKGRMGLFKERNNYGTQTALLCQIEVELMDGRRQRIVSDESFLCAPSPVLFSEIYDGETYDARKEIENWCAPGRAPSGFSPVSAASHPMDSLCFQPGARIRIHEELPAQDVFQTPGGDTVVDFGQNLTGFIRLNVQGHPGDILELNLFEVLDKDQHVYTKNLRTAKQTIRYTLRGGAREVYQPLFTFQGFRYARVRRWPGTPKAENFVACAVHTDMARTGFFQCSNPLLNQLMHNVLWGLKGNFLDVPTDCPQRDERLGWTGDAQIFAGTACFLMDAYPFFRKWLADLKFDQTPDGGVPHVVPDLITGRRGARADALLKDGTHSAAAWADAAVIIPWNLYLAYGDERILTEQYDSMKAWIEFMRAHAEGCVWRYQLQFGDWVALDAMEGSYFGATPNELTCAAYYAFSTGLFAKAARALGRDLDAQAYEALHAELAADFGARFFDEHGNLTADTQTAHILALHFGLTPAQYLEQTVQGLIRLLKRHQGHLVTGFVGTPYFTHALSENGRLSEAYELLLKEDFPSWLYQVKMGATTIWEHWDGIKPDGSMWSPDMNSFNHYAYGAIGEWIARAVAGIDTDERSPGYKNTRIRPRVGGGLRFVNARYESVYGAINVRWTVEAGLVTLTFQVPHNAGALVELVDAREIVDAGMLDFAPAERGFLAQAGSGEYVVKYRV